MAPAEDAAERAKAIAAFFSRADETEFAEDKPFADLDGGLEGIISKLTSVDVSIKKFPVGTGKLAGANLAYLVVRSELTKTQLTELDAFLDAGFPEKMYKSFQANVTKYRKAIQEEKDEAETTASEAQKKVPNADEQAKIIELHGASWLELVAGATAVAVGSVPSRTESWRLDTAETLSIRASARCGASTACLQCRSSFQRRTRAG